MGSGPRDQPMEKKMENEMESRVRWFMGVCRA